MAAEAQALRAQLERLRDQGQATADGGGALQGGVRAGHLELLKDEQPVPFEY